MEIENFKEISRFRWRLEKGFDKNMKADAEIFATADILKAALEDNAVQQVINVASMPGVVSPALAMPDIHYGYGFCIGGVAAFPAKSGVVSPGGVGYDINCGVRCLSTEIRLKGTEKRLESIGAAILRDIPTGLTNKSVLRLSQKEFLKFVKNGAREVVNRFHGDPRDLDYVESSGKLDFHNPQIISQKAYERGRTQLGSLGSGNHFIEIQLVDEIFDAETAAVFGLNKGHLAITIHTGSRGFGHQIASDYIEQIRRKNLSRLKVKDPQLVYAEIGSPEGRQYLEALNGASNFAWANRHLLMNQVIGIFERVFAASREKLNIRLLYDQAHNIAKFESHRVDGKKQELLIHRKGATRAFPPLHPDLPERYRQTGQPVLIPGSMGTASFVLRGTDGAMALTFGSSAHGAGRRLSRHKAIKFSEGMNVREKLKKRNIMAFCLSKRGLREEIPEAYKDIEAVVDITQGTGISARVARLIPLVVVKG